MRFLLTLILSLLQLSVSSGQSLQSLQCNIKLNCFVFRPLCTLGYGCQPILTRTNVACSDCVELCQDMLSRHQPYRCSSFVYDSSHQVCEIYAVTKHECGLALYPARTYGVPLANVACETEATAASSTTPSTTRKIATIPTTTVIKTTIKTTQLPSGSVFAGIFFP